MLYVERTCFYTDIPFVYLICGNFWGAFCWEVSAHPITWVAYPIRYTTLASEIGVFTEYEVVIRILLINGDYQIRKTHFQTHLLNNMYEECLAFDDDDGHDDDDSDDDDVDWGFLSSFVFSMIMILWVRFVHAFCVEYRFISQRESFPWTIAVIHYSHSRLSVNTNIIKNTNSHVLSRATRFSRIPMERQQCLWRVLWSRDVCHWPPRPVVMMVGPRPMPMEAGIQLHETCRHFSEFAVNMVLFKWCCIHF